MTHKEITMSLTSFIGASHVRQGFRAVVVKPTFKCDRNLVAPPLTITY